MSNLAMMMGLSSSGGGVDVASAFKANLHTGNGGSQDIVTGVDLSTNGGALFGGKSTAATDKYWYDTTNAFAAVSPPYSQRLKTNDAAGLTSELNALQSFNTDGFSTNSNGVLNVNGAEYITYSFVKTPKFFEMVQYTGTGAAQTISHNLRTEVGMIWIKGTDAGNQDWAVYHRHLGGTKSMRLDDTRQEATNFGYFNDTDATSTEFTVGYLGDFNTNGNSYMAYLFAHDSAIQCGGYVGNGSSSGPEIDVGFRPQWIMIKRTDAASNWRVVDTARGIPSGSNSSSIVLDTTTAASSAFVIELTDTGFIAADGSAEINANTGEYIYCVIKEE
jgi:hypothetical protein